MVRQVRQVTDRWAAAQPISSTSCRSHSDANRTRTGREADTRVRRQGLQTASYPMPAACYTEAAKLPDASGHSGHWVRREALVTLKDVDPRVDVQHEVVQVDPVLGHIAVAVVVQQVHHHRLAGAHSTMQVDARSLQVGGSGHVGADLVQNTGHEGLVRVCSDQSRCALLLQCFEHRGQRLPGDRHFILPRCVLTRG